MKIFFECNICQQQYVTKSVLSGFKVACPKCQTRIQVPFDSVLTSIIEIDFRDVIDPTGENRAAIIDYLGNERKKEKPEYVSHALNEIGGWTDTDGLSDRELPWDMKYLHPRVQERISEIDSNIQRLKSEIATCTEGQEAIQIMKDEIDYWKEEKHNLKANPKKFIFRMNFGYLFPLQLLACRWFLFHTHS